jgi:hypothetical protein
MKRVASNLALLGAILICHSAYADVLNGRFVYLTVGTATISPPTSGVCQSTGTVPASLSGGEIAFQIWRRLSPHNAAGRYQYR